MKEPYGEGLAPHTDPKSCVDGREAGGEALTGARTGQPLSCEIQLSGTPTLLTEVEGNTEGGAMREPSEGPAQSKTLRTCGNSMHGNREIPGIPSPDGGDGRSGKAGSHTPDTYVTGKSDGCIVPGKPPNKGRQGEPVCGGGGGKAVNQGKCGAGRPRPGHRAGQVCRPDCYACEKWQGRIRLHGSPRCCTM